MDEAARYLNEFVQFRPHIKIKELFPDAGVVDALLTDSTNGRDIVMEVTRCYPGDRASGQAQQAEQTLEEFRNWLIKVTGRHLGTARLRAEYDICFHHERTRELVGPHLHEWVRKGRREHSRAAFEAIVCSALREARTAGVAPIDIPDSAPEDLRGLFNARGSQVRLLQASTQQFDLTFQVSGKLPNDGGWWTPYIPMTVGVTTDSVIAAIEDKRRTLHIYKNFADRRRASGVWLLIVAEQTWGLDEQVVLYDERGCLKSALMAAPQQFDNVYLLASGPRLPKNWDLKRDGWHYSGGPLWELYELWPWKRPAPG